MTEFITYSKHFVVLTGGWQDGGGARKMGSFNTIRALSSALQRGTESRERLVNKQEGVQTLSRQCKTPNNNLDVNISRMLRRCFECKPSQRGCLPSDGLKTPRVDGVRARETAPRKKPAWLQCGGQLYSFWIPLVTKEIHCFRFLKRDMCRGGRASVANCMNRNAERGGADSQKHGPDSGAPPPCRSPTQCLPPDPVDLSQRIDEGLTFPTPSALETVSRRQHVSDHNSNWGGGGSY